MRVSDAANFGDIEQSSVSFYERFPIAQLMALANANDSLILVYNRADPCCFADPSASAMQTRFPDFRIVLTDLDKHAFVARDIMALLE